MNDFLDFYKENCAVKCLLGTIGSVVTMLILFYISMGQKFYFLEALFTGLVISLPVCITLFIWKPVSNVLTAIFTPIIAFLTGISGLFYILFIPLEYFLIYAGPFLLLLGIVFYIVNINVYIFGTILAILTIANILLSIFCLIAK